MQPPFVDIHTHAAKTAADLIQIVNLDLEQDCSGKGYCSYGIHPWTLDNTEAQIEEMLPLLEERLQLLNVLALGEAGLDKMHKSSYEKQMELFERQIELSEKLQKPMILHDVKCHNEILALRKKHKAKQPWVLHGFNGTGQDIRQLTGYGLYLSVGEDLLHSERKIGKSLGNIPLDLLFLETDMAKTDIGKVYDAAARLLEMDLLELRTRIFANFARVFSSSQSLHDEARPKH